jgi:tRNA/tmRNA/rRNA uracil-C5-methylase (TrmA/RlmC/RlmD family)
VLDESPHRVPAPCPYARSGECGGCDWQHIDLTHQRQLKGDLVAEQLARQAKVTLAPVATPVAGDSDGFGWRTRLGLAVDGGGRAGLRPHRSSHVTHIDDCLLATETIRSLAPWSRTWPGTTRIDAIASASTGDALIVAEGGRPRPIEGASLLLRRGRRLESISGRPGVREQVDGRTFWVSADGFWQVHPGAPEALSSAVARAAAIASGESVLDLYCGAGLLTAPLAVAAGPRGRVDGVELSAPAIVDARRNLADLTNVSLTTGAVTPDTVARFGRPDVVVVDPPRSGVGPQVAAALARSGARRVVYVACDPVSLGRDAAVLLAGGWRLSSLDVFDVFPMTWHVESVAVFDRMA